jgi:flagellar motor switch protein FliN/FliY
MKTDMMAGGNDLSFLNILFNAMVETMTTACGFPWSITSTPDEEVTPEESEPVRIMLTVDGSLCGELLLEFDRTEASTLVSKLLRTPVNEFGDEQSEALRALTEKASSVFCGGLQQKYGVFTIKVSSAPPSVFDSANMVRVLATSNEGNRISVVMRMNSALTESLSIHCPEESVAAGAGESAESAVEKKIAEPVNLDLVMDVELNVTLRFGQRHLTLREVLELASGSVVELDRQVDEPVELLLNGKVIARGEAVVIDGNYGLRVSEVLQPMSSLVHG